MRELATTEEREQALGELESLLFAATRPLRVAEIARRLALTEVQGAELLAVYRLQLEAPARGLQLREAGDRYRLETKPLHNDILTAERRERPLTAQALEVLAVIALAQPVSTQRVSRTRGTESYAAIETLRRHGLVAPIDGPASPGKAAQWRTTQRLLDRLGLKSVAELAQRGAQQTLLADRSVARRLANERAGLSDTRDAE